MKDEIEVQARGWRWNREADNIGRECFIKLQTKSSKKVYLQFYLAKRTGASTKRTSAFQAQIGKTAHKNLLMVRPKRASLKTDNPAILTK
jgi:hypothetical protein